MSSNTATHDNESMSGKVATAIILCPAIAAIFVALRIYTRFWLTKKRFLEDYCICVALALSATMSVFMGISVLYGFGRHIQTISPAELTEQSKVGIGGIQFYILTHMALKLSILLQYARISVLQYERRLCYFLMALLVGQSLAMCITHLSLCNPFQALWTPNLPGAKCLNRTMVYFLQLGFTLAMDFIVLIVPLFILRHLNLKWQQRFVLCIALAFGGMACIVSVLRIQTIVASTQSTDGTWDKVPSAFYGVIEPNLGIVCACLVTLRPLFRQYFSTKGPWFRRGSDSSETQAGPSSWNKFWHRPNQISEIPISGTSGGSTQVLSVSADTESGKGGDGRSRGSSLTACHTGGSAADPGSKLVLDEKR